MKLLKNQRGDAHMLVMFVALFAVIGVVGVVVSQASPAVIGVKGVVVKTTDSKTNPEEVSMPYVNARGTISKVQECKRRFNFRCKSGNIRKVAAFTTDQKGEFTRRVGPGQYQVSIDKSRPEGPDCPVQTINVARAQHADVKVTCVEKPAVAGDRSGIIGTALINRSCSAELACSAVMIPLADASGYVRRAKQPGSFSTQELYPFKTDAEGRFTVTAGPGSYIVKVEPKPGSEYPKCREQEKVEVKDSGRAEVTIYCQAQPQPAGSGQPGTRR